MQKKKSEPGGSQIKDLLDATEERKTRNPERSQSERRENKNNNSSFQIQLQLIIELKILFYFSPLLHEYSKSPHSGCLRIQNDDTLPACVLRIRCLTLRLSKILKKSSTVAPTVRVRTHLVPRGEKNKKAIQHLRFPCSPLPKY